MSINLKISDYTLLYIEDDKATQMVTSMFLKNYFKSITEASNGKEAFALYHKIKPDIIITDIEMPEMNGLNFCKEIRKKDKETPIIITTAYTRIEYLLEAISLNLIKYLGKPLKELELMEALSNCFEQLELKESNIVQLTKDVYFDTFNHALSKNNSIIHLSVFETLFLDILIKNKHRIVSYIEIENFIWNDKYMSIDSLRSLVKKIRGIIGKESIQNISKTGYRIKIYA